MMDLELELGWWRCGHRSQGRVWPLWLRRTLALLHLLLPSFRVTPPSASFSLHLPLCLCFVNPPASSFWFALRVPSFVPLSTPFRFRFSFPLSTVFRFHFLPSFILFHTLSLFARRSRDGFLSPRRSPSRLHLLSALFSRFFRFLCSFSFLLPVLTLIFVALLRPHSIPFLAPTPTNQLTHPPFSPILKQNSHPTQRSAHTSRRCTTT